MVRHAANAMLDFLRALYGRRIMSQRYPDRQNHEYIWPPLSPWINQITFLWDVMKDKLFPKKPRHFMDLINVTDEACRKICEDDIL